MQIQKKNLVTLQSIEIQEINIQNIFKFIFVSTLSETVFSKIKLKNSYLKKTIYKTSFKPFLQNNKDILKT